MDYYNEHLQDIWNILSKEQIVNIQPFKQDETNNLGESDGNEPYKLNIYFHYASNNKSYVYLGAWEGVIVPNDVLSITGEHSHFDDTWHLSKDTIIAIRANAELHITNINPLILIDGSRIGTYRIDGYWDKAKENHPILLAGFKEDTIEKVKPLKVYNNT